MADKDAKKPQKTQGESASLGGGDLTTWLIGVFIVLSVLSAVIVPIQNHFGTLAPGGIWEQFSNRYVFSDLTPLGAMVATSRDTTVWTLPENGTLLGTQQEGERGILVGGPVAVLGERWWEVDFNALPDGWVAERDLVIVNSFAGLLRTLRFISYIISLLALTGSIYAGWRITQIHRTHASQTQSPLMTSTPAPENHRWQHVRELLSSENPNDWRAAIIEADIMLEDMVSRMGYPGESLGEQLKAVEPSDFTTIDKAWEAHKIRNRITHEGGDFLLTQREARRAIGLFKEVFEEFKYI